MKREQVERIVAAWKMLDEQEPDASTERLAAMVADTCGCSYGDVFEALGLSIARRQGEVTT